MQSLASVGREEGLVESRPAVGEAVDLVLAPDSHQVLLPRAGRVDLRELASVSSDEWH